MGPRFLQAVVPVEYAGEPVRQEVIDVTWLRDDVPSRVCSGRGSGNRKGGRRKGQSTAPLSRISRLVSMRCAPRKLCIAAPARAKWLAAPRAAAYRGPTAADEQE